MFSNKMKAGRNHMPTVHMMSKSVKLYLITSYRYAPLAGQKI